MNKVVARFMDGRLVKGTTLDFSMSKDVFHIVNVGPEPQWQRQAIPVAELKALFFVRDFAGDPSHEPHYDDDFVAPPGECCVDILFMDGERMLGATGRHHAGRSGFFVVPADRDSNNERCYVLKSACREIAYC